MDEKVGKTMTSGQCNFCPEQRIWIPSETRGGDWACPFIDGSGLHFGWSGIVVDGETDYSKESVDQYLRENRFELAGFTLEEYRTVVKEWRKKNG